MAEENTTTSVEGEMSTTDTTEMVTPTGTGEMSGTETTEEKSQSQPSIDDLNAELEKTRAALKKANREATQSRNAEKELKALKDKIDSESLSVQEKLEQQIAALQKTHEESSKQHQERIINYEVRLQASQLGIADPNDAVKLMDWSEIEYDDNGTPTNVDDLLKALVKSKPYLVTRKVITSGGATNPARSVTSVPQEITAEYIGKLKPADYATLSAEQKAKIQQFMLNPGRR